MSKLARWMKKNRKLDGDVADAAKLSRSQVSRIRREKTSATYETAMKLEQVTGIRWFHFMARK